MRLQAGDSEEMLTDVLDLDAVTRVRRFGTVGVSRMWDQIERQGPEMDLYRLFRGPKARNLLLLGRS